MARIVMWVSQDGFRDEELFEPLEYLRSKGHDVMVVAHKVGMANSKFGKSIGVAQLDGVDQAELDAFLLVGGPGTYDYVEDGLLHDFARIAFDSGKLVGAICYSPNILARSGILKGKRSAVSSDDTVTKGGALCTGRPVESDGNVITADGPSSALDWAKAIDAYLKERPT